MEIISYAPLGYRGQLVSVEVDLRVGIPGTDIIGLPASEVREAKDRVRVALRNSGFSYPTNRVLINLAPADVPKAGNGFDLAIALAVILQSEQLKAPPIAKLLVLGELHLDGSVGPVRGGISAVDEAARSGIRRFLIPHGNHGEAMAVGVGRVGVVKHLAQLGRLLDELGAVQIRRQPSTEIALGRRSVPPSPLGGDYINLRGNGVFKRALALAAAGGHHLLVVGPPGAGKSMGISLLPTILPPLRRDEALEVTRVHSLIGETSTEGGLILERPFRTPHHNSSAEGLLGGGQLVRPGEVSLAHRGILFLDEALEFHRPALQGLREPLEKRRVHISRAGRSYWFPAAFQLFMAANPCPCGNLGRPDRECMCSLAEVERYWRRIGGPLLDRVDLRVAVASRDIDSLPIGESSSDMRRAVFRARARQEGRRDRAGCRYNAELPVERLFAVVEMTERARRTYRAACIKLRLSARASVSVARVARTIADIEDTDLVSEDHVLEAVAHRRNGEDQSLWSTV
ncbi:MAG: YifB family Mg chelatase-like AAA ATPase [Spirochaetaceae bacterium]|nr:YifB family Mg chelatase-like AAA ATPase [Spirochaetaceae bacterium]